jgi:hypothetical protein
MQFSVQIMVLQTASVPAEGLGGDPRDDVLDLRGGIWRWFAEMSGLIRVFS